MLDTVWSFLRGGGAPATLRAGHNVMLYKGDVPNIEVALTSTAHSIL